MPMLKNDKHHFSRKVLMYIEKQYAAGNVYTDESLIMIMVMAKFKTEWKSEKSYIPRVNRQEYNERKKKGEKDETKSDDSCFHQLEYYLLVTEIYSAIYISILKMPEGRHILVPKASTLTTFCFFFALLFRLNTL